MNTVNEPTLPRGVGTASVLLAVLTIFLAVAGSAAAVLAILHWAPRAPESQAKPEAAKAPTQDVGAAAQARKELRADEPFIQQDAVKVADAASSTVFYPVPFASPPNLTLTSKAGSRKFVITRQDELGFTWALALTAAETKDLIGLVKPLDGKSPDVKLPEGKQPDGKQPDEKPDPAPPEFVWVAKGVMEKTASPYAKPHEQKGSFPAPWGQEGEVYFAAPYAIPPNLSLGVSTSTVFIQAVSPLGFSWKNSDKSALPAPTMNWTALGVKATAEQVNVLMKDAKPKPLKVPDNPLKVVEQTGVFVTAVKQKGEVYFPQPYASPPNVVLSAPTGYFQTTIVTQVTPTGFKWEGPSDERLQTGTWTWVAKGILATSLPMDKAGK